MVDIDFTVIVFWVGVALVIFALGIGLAPIILSTHVLFLSVFLGLIIFGCGMIGYAFVNELRKQPKFHKVRKHAVDVDKYIDGMKWR